METPVEIWKPIPGLEGRFEASSCGRIRSLVRNHALLSLCKNANGYLSFCVWVRGERRSKVYPVHRTILETFVGPCPDGLVACHNNDDKLNNSIGNLRWDTRSENQKDKYRNGYSIAGEKHPSAKLRRIDVERIREAAKFGARHVDLSHVYGVSKATINHAVSGRNWGPL